MSTILLKGIVGSTAYGLDTENSDIDTLGVFVSATDDLFRFDKPEQTVVTNNPDVTLHEVEKFMKLALKGNPTILELLYLNDYLEKHYYGECLIAGRDYFLSAPKIKSAYGGYALAQARKLVQDHKFPDVPKNRVRKHARHCARLLLQGQELLKFGHINVFLSEENKNWVLLMADKAVEDPKTFLDLVQLHVGYLDNTKTFLPDVPNKEIMEDLLIEMRRKFA